MKSVLFHVLNYHDHLNGVAPSRHAIEPLYRTPEKRSWPLFRTPDLRKGTVPGVTAQPQPFGDDAWEHWVCDWTEADMAAMGTIPHFAMMDRYADKIPDAWYMGQLFVNAKARAAFERHAPDAFLYVPATLFARTSQEKIKEDRWVCVPRHWLQVAGEEKPWPDCDFSVGVLGSVFRAAQEDSTKAAWLASLGCFSMPRGLRPTLSPQVFDGLMSEGLSGLKEKTGTALSTHAAREVVTHVWDVSSAP